MWDEGHNFAVYSFYIDILYIFFVHCTPCLPSPGELVTTPLFDGEESYIAYPPLTNIHDDLRVELEFKPMERDGLMFFCGGKKMKVEDFVAISMVDGRVEFRYELGTGKKINIDLCHIVSYFWLLHVSRKLNLGIFLVMLDRFYFTD